MGFQRKEGRGVEEKNQREWSYTVDSHQIDPSFPDRRRET